MPDLACTLNLPNLFLWSLAPRAILTGFCTFLKFSSLCVWLSIMCILMNILGPRMQATQLALSSVQVTSVERQLSPHIPSRILFLIVSLGFSPLIRTSSTLFATVYSLLLLRRLILSTHVCGGRRGVSRFSAVANRVNTRLILHFYGARLHRSVYLVHTHIHVKT